MSEYHIVQLQANDHSCICKAIEELGFVYEVHESAVPLVGYIGDQRSNKANIIIRRKNVGAGSNDIGFLRNSDGTYQLIISEFDKRQTNGLKFLNNFNQIYGKHRTIKQAQEMGYSVLSTETTKEGKLVMQLVSYN